MRVHTGQFLVAVMAGLLALAPAWGGPPLSPRGPLAFEITLPTLECERREVREAFRIALGDVVTNIQPYASGLNHDPVPVLLAGLRYPTPWTRDSAINVWNGLSLLAPDVARNNLRAVLERDGDRIVVGGEYWDAVVWIIGAWHHVLWTGDREFLALARQVAANTLRQREETEYDPDDGLFRGPGWSDGVAAYPDRYATAGRSAIMAWREQRPQRQIKVGKGFPMKALSTNCLYFGAYEALERMDRALGKDGGVWSGRAAALKSAINRRLWDPSLGNYRFFIDPDGPCDQQEALGAAYAILLGVADEAQTASIFSHQHITPAGVPCGWPNLARYAGADGLSFGRHIGTVWPQIQGFWAEAAARFGRVDALRHELFTLARHAVRDQQFAELYHPITGLPYGGLQEGPNGGGIILWEAKPRQSWAATAFLRMIMAGVVGMRVDPDGLRFQPCVPEGLGRVVLRGVRYREMSVEVEITGHGTRILRRQVEGSPVAGDLIQRDGVGRVRVVLEVGT